MISQPSCTKAVKTAVLLDHPENPKWALAKPNTTRFTYWLRKFVFDAFMEGEVLKQNSHQRKLCLWWEISNTQTMANFSNQKNLLQRIKFNHYLVQCHNSKELKNFKHSTQTKKNSAIYTQKVMIMKNLMTMMKEWMLLRII